jgi:hypothetical protein
VEILVLILPHQFFLEAMQGVSQDLRSKKKLPLLAWSLNITQQLVLLNKILWLKSLKTHLSSPMSLVHPWSKWDHSVLKIKVLAKEIPPKSFNKNSSCQLSKPQSS